MARGLISRLFSAPLVAIILSGGGGLPVLDGLIFHTRERAVEANAPHYEGTSGHHADGCAVRSTAHQARFTATIAPSLEVVAAPAVRTALQVPALRCAKLPPGRLHSRGPPLFG